MDIEKGCLLAWMSVVFFNRNSEDKWTNKRWLPNVPHLAELVRLSNAYTFTDHCYQEVVYLGRVSGYTYGEFLRQLNVPGMSRGFSAANPIDLDDPSDASSDLSATNNTNSESLSDRVSLEVGMSMSDATDGVTTDIEESGYGDLSSEVGAETVEYCVCDAEERVDHCVCE